MIAVFNAKRMGPSYSALQRGTRGRHQGTTHPRNVSEPSNTGRIGVVDFRFYDAVVAAAGAAAGGWDVALFAEVGPPRPRPRPQPPRPPPRQPRPSPPR